MLTKTSDREDPNYHLHVTLSPRSKVAYTWYSDRPFRLRTIEYLAKKSCATGPNDLVDIWVDDIFALNQWHLLERIPLVSLLTHSLAPITVRPNQAIRFYFANEKEVEADFWLCLVGLELT